MNSLLDGYNEKQPQGKGNNGSLLDGYKEPEIEQQPQNNGVTVGQGLSNIARDLAGVGKGLIQGIPQFVGSVVENTATTGENIKNDPNNLKKLPAAVLQGAAKGVYDIGQGLVDLPESIAASYNGRPFERKFQLNTLPQAVDFVADRVLSPDKLNDYYNWRQQTRQDLSAVPLASQIGEFIPAMIPVGRAAGLGKGAAVAQNTAKLTKAQKALNIAKDIGKGAGVGGAYGFIATPADLEQRAEALGGGLVAGGAFSAGALGLKAGVPKVAEVTPKIVGAGVDAVKSVSAQIVKSFNDVMNSPTSFDRLREIHKTVGDKVSPAAISDAQIRNINNDLQSYANLLETQQTGEYFGQKLDESQLKAVKRQIYKLEDSFRAQNDFINQNINRFDLDTLLEVQQNLQGRFKPTEIQDGYNVYGVPVKESRVDAFNRKYEPYKTQETLDRIQAEQRQRLENYRQKLIEEGKIKNPVVEEIPDSLLDGYEKAPQEVKPIAEKTPIKPIEETPIKPTEETPYKNPASLEGYPIEDVKRLIPFTDKNNIKAKEGGKVDFSTLEKVDNIKDATYHDAVDGGFYRVKPAEPKPAKIEAESSRYKYDVGAMATKNGLSKAQREYIAETVLKEYTGDLYKDVKTEHIFDKEKNPKYNEEDFQKLRTSDEVINLFIPGTNARFTVYKNPLAIRTLFDRLGIKLSDNIVGAEKYRNKSNPALDSKFDLKVFDGEYISDGNIAIKPEYVNIKDDALIKTITSGDTTKGYNMKVSQLIPKDVKPLKDTNSLAELGQFKGKVRIFENEKGEKIAVDEKFAKYFDDYQLYQSDNILSAIVAKKQNGDVVGLVMPIAPKTGGYAFDNIRPNKKQSTFDKKVYKDVEPAVTNWGKQPYDKTGKSAFETPRIKLETEGQALSKVKKQLKVDKAKNLKTAKEYNTALKDGIREWDSQIRIRQYDSSKTLNEFINQSNKIGKEWGYDGTKLREIMPFLRERTGIPENLNRPDLKEIYNKLTDIQKRKLTDMADNLSKEFEKYWDEYQATHADEVNEGSKEKIENYITHIWDLDRKQKSMMTNYFATKSRFAKERTIKTLFDGIQGIEMPNGETLKLQPKTLDYAQILQVQSDNLIKTTFDKLLADAVKDFKTADGVSLVMPASKAPSDWVTINHPALNKTLVRPIESTVGEVMTPELQNILAEMGVAVGRRLNPGATLGVYRHKAMRPEISLQRWFSNKTLAHEIGHAIDANLKLRESGFVNRYRDELLELNEERINALSKAGKKRYAQSDAELIAELFGFLFNDPKMTSEIAPKATREVIERLSKSETLKKLLPDNFDWKNAKHILEQSTTEMFKTAVKVHPDIADTLRTVFDNVGERTDFGKFFDNTNATLKQAQLGFSGFHAVALSEAAFANMGVSRVMKSLNPVKLFNAVKNNDWDIYKKDKLARQAIEDGLQIGATIDINRGLVEGIVEDLALQAEKRFWSKPLTAPLKAVGKLQKLNNKVLWDYLHNNYKLDTYEMLLAEESRKGIVSKRRRQEIAHWVNDSFGGQVWENLGIKSSQRQFEGRALLSPDWLRSTTRQFLGLFSTESGHRAINKLAKESEFWRKAKEVGQEWGINSITDDVTATGMRGKIARRFWMRALIQYSLYSNVLNAIFREKDRKEHPELYSKKMTVKDYTTWGNSKGSETYVFLGRNSDGTERYWRLGKQFREVPELVEKPIEKIGGKASPMAQLVSQTFTSKSVGGFENKELADKKGLERVPALAKLYGQAFMPFSFNSAVNPQKDFTFYDFLAPTSRGLTFYKGRELYMDAMKNGDKSEIKTITEQLRRNNLDPNEIAKAAAKQIRKDAYSNVMKKLDNIKKKRSK